MKQSTYYHLPEDFISFVIYNHDDGFYSVHTKCTVSNVLYDSKFSLDFEGAWVCFLKRIIKHEKLSYMRSQKVD